MLYVSHFQPFKVKQMYLLILGAFYLGIGERLGQVSYSEDILIVGLWYYVACVHVQLL